MSAFDPKRTLVSRTQSCSSEVSEAKEKDAEITGLGPGTVAQLAAKISLLVE
jgi:hypothetical protein